ncbi:hypothetical protein PX699_24210, partial [Sphingobium sp. H39-3-25]|uniref:hypothetical protein n=1 Tax=Sphingobium arseniciresistens TaxID=3030834 RepID=UPI0023B98502|nr:hypothetical protein [Sphingobium arseniciresistens]
DQPRQPILPAIIVAAQPAIVVVATHAAAPARPKATISARNLEINASSEVLAKIQIKSGRMREPTTEMATGICLTVCS